MVGHARFRIGRSQSGDQFGLIRFAGHDRATSGFSYAQCLFSKNERDPILLPDPTVTRDAVLIQDGSYIAAEAHLITGPLRSERSQPPARRESANNQGDCNERHDPT